MPRGLEKVWASHYQEEARGNLQRFRYSGGEKNREEGGQASNDRERSADRRSHKSGTRSTSSERRLKRLLRPSAFGEGKERKFERKTTFASTRGGKKPFLLPSDPESTERDQTRTLRPIEKKRAFSRQGESKRSGENPFPFRKRED